MTTALLDPTTRKRLRSKAGRVERLVEFDDEDRRGTWYRGLEDAVLDLVNTLPAGTEDYEARQLFLYLTELHRAIDGDPAAADADGRVRLAALRMGDVARRLDRRLEHAALEDPDAAARAVFDELDPLGATELARLLGVSTKTIGAWRAGRPVKQKVERVKLVAQLVSYLRYSMTPTGLLMWFGNEADLLDGRSPLELLDGGVRAAWEPLVAYARGGRGQLAG